MRPCWGVEAAARGVAAVGIDDNPGELLNPLDGSAEPFSRLLLEARADAFELAGIGSSRIEARGFVERYVDLPAESRLQGELRLGMERPIARARGLLELEVGLRHRAYPDSAARDFDRRWLRVGTRLRFGPRSVVRPSVQLWRLDFDRTRRVDQSAYEVRIDYERMLDSNWMAHLGAELGRVHHGRPSIRRGEDASGDPILTFEDDQSDGDRGLHLGLRYAGRSVVRLQCGLRSRHSNSLGSNWRRWELRWLAARPLGRGISAQCYGTVERVAYLDDDLDETFLLRPSDELEANEDNNALVVGLSRPVAERLVLEARAAWYRNESLLIGEYYDKRTWTLSLAWQSVSDF